MKTFVAIELDNKFKEYLSEARDIVRGNAVKGNFTRDGNFHMTLRYLGVTAPIVIKTLQKELKIICEKYSITELKIEKLGAFNKGNRSIIFIEPQIEDSLRKMRDEIEAVVIKLGFEPDYKAYKPHITLGREINIEKPIDDLDDLIPLYTEPVIADGISLMESTIEDGKLVYKRIFKIKLINA